ncbi:fimbria/pilus outer membrane usher protein [Sphingopyxis sp. RIFCSPHIGHO2_12_FULL_65_19]|uniref:hypothetical protein n=1 Tax=Sphingopyxis sp. RIFCSPHIGHO2_12_FULL_65_19 TaxID=1802172 RepID=UPI0008B7063C|nr:hypothetical protein [Sphingopyxis sp. RIFCSPHIGHO2_12_FULL_65_19]OHD06782.1 MAG: hypothetical protein A3E77_03005 [Sphingopyxis sp. RIFCSPHIGHO2_12_FULL_65_19]
MRSASRPRLLFNASLLALLAFAAGGAWAQTPAAPIQPRADADENAPASPPDAASGDVADDASPDDIFKQVFGRARPAISAGDYAAQIENIYVGDYLIKPTGAGEGSVSARFVRDILAPTLVAGLEEQVAALANGRDDVPFSDIRGFGIEVEFDEANLVLAVRIPAQMRDVSDLVIRSVRKQANLERVKQSSISAYVSARIGMTYIEDMPGPGEGLYRTAADIDLAANLHGLVAEAELRYDDRSNRRLRRGDVRLTYDDRASLIRYELGDLTIGRRPFQLAPRIAGASMYRKYSINPYLNIRPVPEQEFQLERPARVDVLVNGIPSRTFNLSSGRYRLRDFPLVSSAANDVELIITYDSGETERLSFPAFFDIDLLNPGLLDFAINVGVPFRDEDGVRRYDTGNYNGTGYLRYGVNKSLTLGINWEGDKNFSNLGGEVLWATGVGTFAVNAAVDALNPKATAGRASLQYRWRDTDATRDLTVDGVLLLTGKDYRSLNSILGGELISMQARLRAGMRLSEPARVQIYGSFERFRGFGKGYAVGVNYSHRFRFGNFSASLEYRSTPEDRGPAFNIGLLIPFGRSSVNATFDSNDNNARLNYSRTGTSGIGSLSTSAAIERRDGADRVSGRVAYVDNRFEATFEQIARNYFTDKDSRDLRSEFTFGTALVMADGHFALSRPVSNGFAIFDPDKAAGGLQLMVEPRVGFGSTDVQYTARSGALGPAVVSTLAPYFNRGIQVDAPDAPVGNSLGGQVFMLTPGYRAGYYIPVGSENNVSIVGNLADRDGDPISYASGEATVIGADGKPGGPPIQLFTNETGRFFVEGVEAGRGYAVDLQVGGQRVSTRIDVPDDADGLFRLGAPVKLEIDAPAPAKENGDE